MKLQEFCVTLAVELIGTYCSRKRIGRPSILRHLLYGFAMTTFQPKQLGSTAFIAINTNHEPCSITWYCRTCRLHLCHTGEKRVLSIGPLVICLVWDCQPCVPLYMKYVLLLSTYFITATKGYQLEKIL